jgi:preprotein translocase subunit SecA
LTTIQRFYTLLHDLKVNVMAIFSSLIKLIFGDPIEKVMAAYRPFVEAVNACEPQLSVLSDEELRAKTVFFKEQLALGKSLDDLSIEAFAVVREASKRVLNMRHFDVQLIGGLVLHQGKISEMKTGEGKTLVSTLPAYLNALEGQGVYVVTVNDYLAKRDSEWMGQLFRFLGLEVGLIHAAMSPEERVKAYACDITYGTNNEFGFDYLRDHLAYDLSQCCQSRRHFAIIDEVDSILIDEARTPLIISGPVKDSTQRYAVVAEQVKKLVLDTDFTLEEKHKNAILTEAGTHTLEKLLGVDDLYSVENMEMAHMAVQCLKALHIYVKDVDYVVKDDEVLIVDEFTGRILDGRRYSDGLHQAIEAVEGLQIKQESQTLATVTLQNYFRMFPKLAGMTGTALTEEAEFVKIYNLEVVPIPPNRIVVRDDMADVVYKTKAEKYRAIMNEVKEAHAKGQPVLVGTISIEISELLSKMFRGAGIPHSVLNAKYHEREAEIIAQAGQKGTVTIATNMAGRGTDIVLGEGVADLGGLFVIGTERHESRRIDNQLRGRSGRQGDPGKSRFYVSLEDELMRLFGSDRIAKVMESLGLPEDTPIEHALITRSIEKAQSKVEKYYFGIRKQILEYDDVMNRQRETIYAVRRRLLMPASLDDKIREWVGEVVRAHLMQVAGTAPAIEESAKKELAQSLGELLGAEHFDRLIDQFSTREALLNGLIETIYAAYEAKKAAYPEGLFESVVTRHVILSTVDRMWVDHLHQMESLREGIGLRAWGQKDPLVEYKTEAFGLFKALLLDISQESLAMIFKAHLVIEEAPAQPTLGA